MTPRLRAHFEREPALAVEAEVRGERAEAWRYLERAQVLSQAHALPHLRVHGRMFGFAWRGWDTRELLGQLPRLLLAAPGSGLGRAPRGNTGGADVGIFISLYDDRLCAWTSRRQAGRPRLWTVASRSAQPSIRATTRSPEHTYGYPV